MENQEQQQPQVEVRQVNYKNIQTMEDVVKIFKALGLVIAVDYAKENDMEHLIEE